MLRIFRDIKELLTLKPAAEKGGRKITEADLGLIQNACLVCDETEVVWVGPQSKLSEATVGRPLAHAEEISLHAEAVMPAFVECHTHLMFAGDRQKEFELRNQGMSYQDIAKQGGGILSTVQATRGASDIELLALGQKRVDRFLKQGVTRLEIKSGYGLDEDTELRLLKLMASLKGPSIVKTFLGPHAVPSESKNSEEYFLRMLKLLPSLKGLASRVDIFVEEGYFSPEQARRYFQEAKALGLGLTGHMDQLSRSGGVELGVDLGLDSVDHCLKVSSGDIDRLAQSEVTAVLLPAADFYLKIPYPPARDLIDRGVRVALSTDFNPGSSPTQALSFVGVLARLEMKMSLAEVIVAYTNSAARALGLHKEGAIVAGYRSNFICLDASWRNLFYQVGEHPVKEVWKNAHRVFVRP